MSTNFVKRLNQLQLHEVKVRVELLPSEEINSDMKKKRIIEKELHNTEYAR